MAFGGIIRELVTRLGFSIDDAEARRYNRLLGKLGKKIRGFGRSLSLFVTLPIVGLGTAFIKAAADAEETESKFKEVFKSIQSEADATAKALSKDFDLANVSAQEMLSSTGDILIGFGFTEKAALDLSSQVNSLAVDIASFKNVQGGAAQASNAITKALLGEREMLKGIGIAILEEDVKLKVAQLTAEGMTFATNRQAKSFATLRLIIDRSTKAIGDYARTSGSATNQSRKLRQRFIELAVTFGKVLLPLFTDLVEVLSSVVEWLNSFSPAGRKAIIIIAAIVAVLGPLLIVLGSVLTIVASIVGLVGAIPLLVAAAVAAFAVISTLIVEDIAAFIEGRDSVFGLMVNQAKMMIKTIFAFLSETWVGWIAEHVTPWINQVKALLDVGTQAARAPLGLGSQIVGGAAGVAQFGAAGLRDIGRRVAAAGAGDSTVTINLEMTLNGAFATPASVISKEVVEGVHRSFAEARSRGAVTPRMAP